MILVINGNICSGKSSVSKIISETLDWPIFAIDDYRILFNNDCTPEGDRHAVDMLCSDISNHKGNCLLEITTTNKRFNEIVGSYQGFHKIVTLSCGVNTLIVRYDQRKASGYLPAPFPYYKSHGIHAAMHHIEWHLDFYPSDLEVDSENTTPANTANFIISKLELK